MTNDEKKKTVLIYGEYSGYGKSLAKGFRELGHHSEVVSFSGDGFKKIKSGMVLSSEGKIKKLFSLIRLIPEFLKYKNILILNPDFLKFKLLGPLVVFLFKITRKNIVLLCCGDDVEFIKRGKNGEIPNWPYQDIPLPEKKYYSHYTNIIINWLVASASNKIIPVMYDYHKAWSLSRFAYKLTGTIPLACDAVVKKIKYKDFEREKIVIMHGINREGFKGSKIVKDALIEIKKKHGDRVDIILPEKLSLEEYLKVMDHVDIAIDQTKSNSYGMNAIYSMLSGHVVLAPANNFFKNDLKIKNCPVVTIQNNVDSIVEALNNLIINRDNLLKHKIDSQLFAIEYHSSYNVAVKINDYLK